MNVKLWQLITIFPIFNPGKESRRRRDKPGKRPTRVGETGEAGCNNKCSSWKEEKGEGKIMVGFVHLLRQMWAQIFRSFFFKFHFFFSFHVDHHWDLRAERRRSLTKPAERAPWNKRIALERGKSTGGNDCGSSRVLQRKTCWKTFPHTLPLTHTEFKAGDTFGVFSGTDSRLAGTHGGEVRGVAVAFVAAVAHFWFELKASSSPLFSLSDEEGQGYGREEEGSRSCSRCHSSSGPQTQTPTNPSPSTSCTLLYLCSRFYPFIAGGGWQIREAWHCCFMGETASSSPARKVSQTKVVQFDAHVSRWIKK